MDVSIRYFGNNIQHVLAVFPNLICLHCYFHLASSNPWEPRPTVSPASNNRRFDYWSAEIQSKGHGCSHCQGPGWSMSYSMTCISTNGSTHFKLWRGFPIFDITWFRLKPFYTDLVDGLNSNLLRLYICLHTSVRLRYICNIKIF